MERKTLNVKQDDGKEIRCHIFPSSSFDEIKADIKEFLTLDLGDIRLYRKDQRTEITSAEEFFPIPEKTLNPLGKEYFERNDYYIYVKDKDWQPPVQGNAPFPTVHRSKDYAGAALIKPMIDPNNSVEKFVSFLRRSIMKGYNPRKHLSPHTTLFASSLTGKTRHCYEALKKVWGVYICWRDPSQSGSPRPSYICLDHGKLPSDPYLRQVWFIKLILVCLDMAHEAQKAGKTREEWLWMQRERRDMDRFSGECFWKEVSERMKKMDQTFFNGSDFKATEFCRNFLKDRKDLSEFLIVSDDARALLSNNSGDVNFSDFHYLRYAATLILGFRADRSVNLGLVFVDILSKVPSPLPSQKPGPSFRPTMSSKGRELMSPYCQLDTWNSAFTMSDYRRTVSWFTEYLGYIHEGTEMPPLEVLHGAYLKRGRHAWMAYLSSNADAMTVMDLAISKMLGGVDIYKYDFNSMAKEVAVAILCCRFGLEVRPTSKLSSDLVEGHMAQCLNISDNRERILIAYPLDGYLVEACCQIMHFKENKGHLFLDKVHDYLANGCVTTGPKGEFFTRMLVCLGIDAAIQSFRPAPGPLSFSKPTEDITQAVSEEEENTAEDNVTSEPAQEVDLEPEEERDGKRPDFPYFREPSMKEPETPAINAYIFEYVKPVSVRHFLCSLFNPEDLEKCLVGQLESKEDEQWFLNGVVFFNCCTQISGSPNQELLQRLFYSCQFGQCHENEAVIDQIIPVLLPDGTWSFIAIQSWLYDKVDPKYKDASTKFEASIYGVDLLKTPCMLLYFSLGYKTNSLVNIKYERHEYALCKPKTKRVRSDRDKLLAKMKHICIGAFGISTRLFPFLTERDVESFKSTAKTVKSDLLALNNPDQRDFVDRIMLF